jgi:hypothetical protein
MQHETSEQPSDSTDSGQPEPPKDSNLLLKSPRTLFAEFPEIAKARELIEKLRGMMPTGVYSINSPTAKGGCRIAIQVEGSRVEEAAQTVKDLGGSPGSVITPKRTEPKATKAKPEPDEPAGDEGDSGVSPKAKSKKATVKAPKEKSARFGKKTECAAPGHGEYGDIESHNKKHHNGKAFVAKEKAAAKGK